MTFMFLIETFDPLIEGCSIGPIPTTFPMISKHHNNFIYYFHGQR